MTRVTAPPMRAPSGVGSAHTADADRLRHSAADLTGRCDVVLFPHVGHVPVEWVVVDTMRTNGVPASREDREAAVTGLSSEGFQRIVRSGGIVLSRRV
ncbi:hypothetical protein [Actinoallomurus liliacearum]|uniref:hypothetical protein n=1 Tax=Actinoallomurus liliacearum TaxID=1080073 RepID=UPI0031E66A83